MLFEEFQNGRHWISEWKDLSNWISMSLWCLPSSFGSIQLTVWEEISSEEIQDGRHGSQLGYLNRTILAILNLFLALMLPTKFRLNLTYGLGGDVIWRISRWPPWNVMILAILNLCVTVIQCTSYQVLAQSDLRFGRRCHLGYWKDFSNFEFPCCHNGSH